MPDQLLDTNILLRHLVQDVPGQSERATAFLRRIEAGEIQVFITDIVIFETVYTLQRVYRVPKPAIRDTLLSILDLPGIALSGKRKYRRVFDLYVDLNISFADAYHAVIMEHLRVGAVVSFDREFDRVAGVLRVEP